MIAIVAKSARFVSEALQKAGPYLLVEILLPGGTLIALLLFVYRRREAFGIPDLRHLHGAVLRAIRTLRARFASLLEAYRLAIWMSRGRHRDRDGLEALAFAPAGT